VDLSRTATISALLPVKQTENSIRYSLIINIRSFIFPSENLQNIGWSAPTALCRFAAFSS
jgi:hypothetical protein